MTVSGRAGLSQNNVSSKKVEERDENLMKWKIKINLEKKNATKSLKTEKIRIALQPLRRLS